MDGGPRSVGFWLVWQDMAIPSPLIITQILTPKKRADLLRRQRLVDFIHESIDRKLLIISASAGYGKTSLLTDYAHDTDLAVCWLSLVESASDPRVFLDYLVSSINHHFPRFGETSRKLLKSGEALSDLTPLVGTLVNEIYETIPDYFVVVIDDYHLVDNSPAVNRVVDALAQHVPENCHLIIASRSIPTLTPRGLALLTARQQIAGLGVNDLRFTAQEIQELLWQNYGQRLPDNAARELAERSEGWITGILLTTHTMWKGLFEGIIRIQGSDSKVYDYLVNEVFSQQPSAVRDFLIRTCILEEMNPLLCDEFLGISNSRDMLKSLEERNLFVSRLEREEEKWYRYHPLFREFLTTKLQEEGTEQVHRLHLRAASVLRESGGVEQAIHHYLLAEEYDCAVEAILAIARDTYDAGKLGMLARWIDALPADTTDANPRLLWLRAKVHSELGELDQAVTLFDRACRGFVSNHDVLGQAQSLVESSVVLRFQGDFLKAIEACARAIVLVQGSSGRPELEQVLASAHRQIGNCQAHLGNLSQGEKELRQALQAYESLGYATNIGYVHNDLGVTLGLAGDLTASEVHFRQALEIWAKIGNIGLAAMTSNNIADGYCRKGEYAEALQLYEEALGQARRAGLDRIMAFALAGIGDIRRVQGKHVDALKTYEEGLQAARQSRDAFIVGYLLDATGNTHRLMGDQVQAVSLVRQAFELARERGAAHEMGLYQTSLGVISYQQGNTKQAEEYLVQARDIFVRSKAKGELARADLYLAQTHYVAGRFQDALDCMQEVLECLLGLGYTQFLLSVVWEVRAVVEYAVSRGMSDTLVGRLLEQADASACTGSEAMSQEPPVADKPILRVYALGEARVLAGDKTIAAADWGMAKSKELLFYLLCHKQRRKEQIGNDLWPELSPARVRSAFHVALYRLRRALAQQDCVVYEGDQYFFNRRIRYWFDVEEFERSIELARSVWDSDRAMAAQYYGQAVGLYRGDLLDGMQSDHDWAVLKREGLLREYLGALQHLGKHHADRGEYGEAIRYYERVLERDNYQESAHREIMRCQVSLGMRSAALKSYHRLAEILERELDAEPAPETVSLYERILQGKPTVQ